MHVLQLSAYMLEALCTKEPLPLDWYLCFSYTHIAAAHSKKATALPKHQPCMIWQQCMLSRVFTWFHQSRLCEPLLQAWFFGLSAIISKLHHHMHVCFAGDRTSAYMGGGFASSPGVLCTPSWATSTWWVAQTGKALESFLKVCLKPSHCTCQHCCDHMCMRRNVLIMCLLCVHYVLPACSECSYRWQNSPSVLNATEDENHDVKLARAMHTWLHGRTPLYLLHKKAWCNFILHRHSSICRCLYQACFRFAWSCVPCSWTLALLTSSHWSTFHCSYCFEHGSHVASMPAHAFSNSSYILQFTAITIVCDACTHTHGWLKM